MPTGIGRNATQKNASKNFLRVQQKIQDNLQQTYNSSNSTKEILGKGMRYVHS